MNHSKVSLLLILLLLFSSWGYCTDNENKTPTKSVTRIKVINSLKYVTPVKNLESKNSGANKQSIGNRIIKIRIYSSYNEYFNTRLVNGSNTNNSQEVNSPVKLFPQPANDQITVNCYSNNNMLSWIKLYSIDGICLLEKEISLKEGPNQFQLDISNLSNGVYNCIINLGFSLAHSKLEVY